MAELPKSIQAYLESAGFTSAQIGIIKNLIDGDEKTVRELAQLTKKGSGTIDEACKKMASEGFLREHKVNSTTKYSIVSFEVIQAWTERDAAARQEAIARQQQDFATYISSLEGQECRPMMHHFEGESGFKDAYKKLMETGEDILHFYPAPYKEEDDPLRKTRQELTKMRQERKIHARYIVPDSHFGRRFKDNDVHGYRETRVVPDQYCPIPYEKITSGSMTLLVNHDLQEACLLQHKHIADSESQLFNVFWSGVFSSLNTEEVEEPSFAEEFSTAMREFAWSKHSALSLFAVGLLSAGVTWGLWENTEKLNIERIREQVLAIAATGTEEFVATDLAEIQTVEDIKKPVWPKVVQQLQGIRERNPDIRFAYILRPTDDPVMFTFISDADSLDPFAKIDLNGDGVIDDADALNYPGFPYDVSEIPGVLHGMSKPYADPEAFTDQWGTFISGFAPIRNSSGVVVAVLGIDRVANDVEKMTLEEFQPLRYFLLFFVTMYVVYGALYFWLRHRDVCMELGRKACSKRGVLVVSGCAVFSLFVTSGMYWYTKESVEREIGARLIAIATDTVARISVSDIESLREENDWRTPAWRTVVRALKQTKQEYKDIVYVYIYRRSAFDPERIEFVADAESINPYANTDTNPANDVDANGDGRIEPDGPDLLQWPGQEYPDPPVEALNAYSESLVSSHLYEDAWGVVLTGYAPIQNESGKTIAVLAVDMEVSDFYEKLYERFSPLQWFFGIFVGLLLLSMLMMCILLHPPAIHD